MRFGLRRKQGPEPEKAQGGKRASEKEHDGGAGEPGRAEDQKKCSLTRGKSHLSKKMNSGGERPRMSFARKIFRVIEWVLTFILALVILSVAFLMIGPRFGLRSHPVMSGSMEPALKVGGIIFCSSVPVEDIRVGDIIGFNLPGGAKVAHRVIDITEEDGKLWFQTKGDANEDPDRDLVSISGEMVDRIVCHIPYLGYFSNFMQSKMAFIFFICFPALILLAVSGRDIWKAVKEIKADKSGKALSSGDMEGESSD